MNLQNITGWQSQMQHIDETKQPSTYAATGILVVVSILAVVGRIAAHWMVQPRLGADDYCALIALVLSLSLCASLIACVNYGLGLHVVAVELSDPNPPQDLVNVYKTAFTTTLIAIPDLFFIKLSLLIFYRRIFATSSRVFRIALYSIGAYVTAWTIATFILFIFRCIPVSFFWERSYGLIGLKPPELGTCLPIVTQQVVPSVLNTVSDILILVLPGLALFPLQMRTSRKLGLFFVFSLGTFVCGVSIVKIYYAFVINNATDSTWYNLEIQLWTSVECCIGLVCACLPCMVPLLRMVTRGFQTTTKRSQEICNGAVPMQDVNAHRFRGGRRLHSLEELGDATLATNSNDTLKSGIPVPVGGEIIPWNKHGEYKNKIKNQAVGVCPHDRSVDFPHNAIKVENGWDVHSERRGSKSGTIETVESVGTGTFLKD